MTKLNWPIASVDIQYLFEQNWRAHFYRRVFSKLLNANPDDFLTIILLLNRESIVTTGQRISLIPMNRYIWRGMMSAYVKSSFIQFFKDFASLDWIVSTENLWSFISFFYVCTISMNYGCFMLRRQNWKSQNFGHTQTPELLSKPYRMKVLLSSRCVR